MPKPSTLLALVAIAGLAAVALPAAATNECRPTGTWDNNGNPVAGPCLQLEVPTAVCGAVSELCVTYYVMLVPDDDGDLDEFDYDGRIIWQETNTCPGLQRVRSFNCPAPDTVVLSV